MKWKIECHYIEWHIKKNTNEYRLLYYIGYGIEKEIDINTTRNNRKENIPVEKYKEIKNNWNGHRIV